MARLSRLAETAHRLQYSVLASGLKQMEGVWFILRQACMIQPAGAFNVNRFCRAVSSLIISVSSTWSSVFLSSFELNIGVRNRRIDRGEAYV